MEKQTNQSQEETNTAHQSQQVTGKTSRRALLRTGLAVGGAGAVGATLLNAGVLTPNIAFAKERNRSALTKGDIAILRFLSAAEILETDLWQQYNELGGIQDKTPDDGNPVVIGGSGSPAYTEALAQLDSDMAQYIHDNTDDEWTHFTFINAYLMSKGADPVNLDEFKTLKGSTATGVDKNRIGKRLTNLLELSVDTSYWTRYRSHTGNPDFGDTFAPAIPGLLNGKFKAIPEDDSDLVGPSTLPSGIPNHLQAIANTAGFHFAFIEQGGTSLYPSLAQRVTNAEVLRILLSIGPTETMHFQTWQDKAGNAPPLTDPTNGLVFPDLNASGSEDTQTNLIMPEPTIFLKRTFPIVSIIRPTQTEGAAMGALKALTDDGLFRGQPPKFFRVLRELAEEADAAHRQV